MMPEASGCLNQTVHPSRRVNTYTRRTRKRPEKFRGSCGRRKANPYDGIPPISSACALALSFDVAGEMGGYNVTMFKSKETDMDHEVWDVLQRHLDSVFSGDAMEALIDSVGSQSGYEVKEHWLQLFGICEECRGK